MDTLVCIHTSMDIPSNLGGHWNPGRGAKSLHIGLFSDPLLKPTFWYRQAVYFDLKVPTEMGG